MKTIACAVFVGLGLFFGINQQAEATTTLNTTLSVKTQYTVDNGLVIHNEPVTQLDLWFTLKHGFWADLWGSSDFQGERNGGQEVDYGLGWGNKRVDVGIFYYDFSTLFSANRFGDVIAPHIELYRTVTLQKHILRPHVRAEYFYATKKSQENSGLFVRLGLRDSWKVTDLVSVTQEARLVRDGSVFGSQTGWVGRYDLGLSYSFAKGMTFGPNFKITAPFTPMKDRDTNIVWGATLTKSF